MADMQTIRAAIVAKLAAVSGVGQVQAYQRYTTSLSDMKVFYKTGNEILGWYVRRVRTSEQSDYPGRWDRTYGWEIRGYKSLSDDNQSEEAFDLLLEGICNAFRDDDTLGGVVDTCIIGNQAGIQINDSRPVMFAGVLCHGATLALNTRVFL